MTKWDKASLPEPIAVQIYLILSTLIPTLLVITFSPHSLSLNLKRVLLSTTQRIIIKINPIKGKIFHLKNTLLKNQFPLWTRRTLRNQLLVVSIESFLVIWILMIVHIEITNIFFLFHERKSVNISLNILSFYISILTNQSSKKVA